MILNNEQIKQKAHELALTHDPYLSRWTSGALWQQFYRQVSDIRSFANLLQDGSASCAQPAEEWLLDNADFIEEQVIIVKQQLSRSFLRDLPNLRRTKQKRVLSICIDYLDHVDGNLDEDSLVMYLNSYQQVSVLSIAEVWSIPLMMRIALINHLAAVMDEVRKQRETCSLAERLLAGIDPTLLSPEILKTALDKAGQEIPLSGSLIVQLIRLLREWADDSELVREWLICKLDNGPESLDRIVSYEYQLQASHQVTTGNLVGSLRNIARWDWNDRFEEISMVENTLVQESRGIYPQLDFSSRDLLRRQVEKLARRLCVPETLVAKQAVALSAMEYEQTLKEEKHGDNAEDVPVAYEELPRTTLAAFYLLEPEGIKKLQQSMTLCGTPRFLPETRILPYATATYFFTLTALLILALLGFSVWIRGNLHFSAGQWIIVVLALLLPASEWVVMTAHWLIECVRHPQALLKYDFSHGIPSEATTMVVVPVIVSSAKEIQELGNHLELHYLANRDSNIYYALLMDLIDSKEENPETDTAILEAAMASIQSLNYTHSRPGGSTFYLFHRHRSWNPSQGVWMGWERKRGALVEFVELLKGRTDTMCDLAVGDKSVLSNVRYIITLDADTQLPMESARQMIGTMHLPYNRPRLNRTRTRVVEGYGILQPCIRISHRSALRSRLAYLYSADPGVDPYTFAISDPYQDGFGQGIFAGKGIFDLNTFAELLCERIPENRVLSHDLLEGGFLRAGLLSNIELIDEYPSTYASYQKRMHRWVRGDWQLLPWMFRHVSDRRGRSAAVDLSPLARWQMIDNMRHSLLLPLLFGILLILNVLPGTPGRWLAFIFMTLSLPLIRQLGSLHRIIRRPRNLLAVVGQVLITIITLPFQSILMMDAILRTLHRLLFTKRNLLEWVSAAEVERRNRGGSYPVLLHMYGGFSLIFLFIWSASMVTNPVARQTCLLVAVLWVVAPLVVRWLNKPVEAAEGPLETIEKEALRSLSHDIWAFFEDYVTEADNWLPPDNVQIEPANGIAHRTSPTNIGLYLACILAARDLGFIDTAGLITRLERTVSIIESLEKWKGHLYNWYDTVSLKPLPQPYVSTVDSGNLLGCLITVKEGLVEWLKSDLGSSPTQPSHMEDALNFALSQEFSVLNTEDTPRTMGEVAPTVLGFVGSGNTPAHIPIEWSLRGQDLAARLQVLIDEADFKPLYNQATKLFHLGYRVTMREPDHVLYDLLASEARLSSFLAIALGHVPVSHWHALGRTMTRVGRRTALLSWSGTMFEYLMPWLFMRTYQNTIWDSTYRAVVRRQIEYAHQRGTPFGISESGYYAFDYRMNYQYRAFGVPGLGFKRGLEQDLVVAPYATILGLPFAKRFGLKDLQKMKELGALGQYGYYEAIDFTAERLPEDQSSAVIKSYMSHHQGMSLLALTNLLSPYKIYERFHRDKRVQAAELLLQERIPAQPKIIKHPAVDYANRPYVKPGDISALREFRTADTPAPEACVLSNGSFTTMVTNSGSGFMRCEGLAVSRWREDPVLDNWGNYMYVRDVTRDVVWSPSFLPCRTESKEQRVQFSPDRATFMRVDDDIRTSLEICVSPEWNADVRRLTLTNTGDEARIIEVTTYSELVMATPMADEAHPAFSKLFIKTEFREDFQCLLAWRRPRQEDEKPLWAAHSLMTMGRTLGPVEYETDRSGFVGRGHTLVHPQGINSHLRGTVGSVSDPAFIMRRRLSVEPGEQVQLFAITTLAGSREDASDIISRYSSALAVERTFQLGWNRSQIELRHFYMTAHEALAFQAFAGRILYTLPLRKERRHSIATNVKGQSGLWAYGISGDIPIVLIRIDNRANLQFVVRMLTGQEYLRRMGCSFDLVILNESPGGYQEDLLESLRRAVEHSVQTHGTGPGGAFIINASQVPEEDQTLLLAVTRVVLWANGPSLRAQTKPPRPDKTLPSMFNPPNPDQRYDSSPQEGRDLMFFNGWGGFSPDGEEYEIIIKNGNYLPAPWINVIANPRFGCLVSEQGLGYTWWQNSRECKLTPWSNDPVLDQPGEMCYLRDEESGHLWPTTPSADNVDAAYTITHRRGSTVFRHAQNGIHHEMTVFVSPVDPVKIVRLQLRNETTELRRLSVTYYAEWVMGVRRQENAPFVITEWDESAGIMLAKNVYQETFRDATAFLGVFSQSAEPAVNDLISNSASLSWTADRLEFLGRNGTFKSPLALKRERLSGRTGSLANSCGAVQNMIAIEPGSDRTVYILLGCDHSREAALKLAYKYQEGSACETALHAAQEFWQRTADRVSVSTPSPEMDVLLNGWLLYQSLGCRMWARSAFYQAGGAFGFRDQLQDSLALLHSRPELTRSQILFHAAHQYEEGDVQHWWHQETSRGIRTHFSDDFLWLPYVVARYVDHTGDHSILAEQVSYLHSEKLHQGEYERYEETRISSRSGALFDHCLLAIDRALERFGEHGLPLMGVGDWNDAMSRVGAQGRGESVWLGWFLCEILNLFGHLCQDRGDDERAQNYRDVRAELVMALNEHAWDGQWYRRAFTDSGQWLGSIYNEECRIDALAQSWAVISGAAPHEKAMQAMQSFDRELVDRVLSVVRLLTPPFERTDPSPGYIQGYPPGIRENGAQYTHGAIWSILAWCRLGCGEKAFELFNILNPVSHTLTPAEVRQYTGEPYVMAADVYTADPHQGCAGWTWYTGAAGWMYQAGIEGILGLSRKGDCLYIKPCIPNHWPGFSVSYRYGSAVYLITVQNPNRRSSGTSSMEADGQEISVTDPYVKLNDDGKVHNVMVTI